MTSEIIVMNKNGIALAADSAVTHVPSNRPPHFQKKLFSLSQHYPAAIMLHDRMQLNHIPLETIIKIYQAQLSQQPPDHFETYITDFTDFLQSHPHIFEHDNSNYSWVYDAINFLQNFGRAIYADWQQQEKGQSLKEHALQCIEEKIERLYKAEDCFNLPEKNIPQLISNELEKFGEYYIDHIFNLFPLGQRIRKKIYELLRLMTIKNNFDMGQSVIVLAGFSKNDIFPKVAQIQIGGLYFNRLKFHADRMKNIDNYNHAQIIPYAMTDTISSFIKGVHPAYEEYSLNEFRSCLHSCLTQLPIQDQQVDSLVHDNYELYRQKLKQYVLSQHIYPVIENIKFLPCDDLAEIAQMLVRISCFQTTVMPGQDSIGGHINVATITKGDGFQWIKKSGDSPSHHKNVYRLNQ